MLPPVSAGTAGAYIAAQEAPAVRSRPRAGVTALTAAAALCYVVFGLIRFRRFRDGTFDLVIFDQAVRGYAHFGAPTSMARGVADGAGAHFVVLGDHWSPILAVLAPLYWIHDGPATLIVAQALLFALAIPPLWIYTRRLLGARAAYFVCGAYALSLPVAAAMSFDFHEVAFVPVLTAVMAERFQASRGQHSLPGILAAIALLMVKEDMGLLLAGYGAYLFVIRQRATGLSFFAGGLAATWVSTRLLIPAFGGSANFYWAYGQFGSSLATAGWHALTHPLQTLGTLVTPRVKITTMLSLVAPLAFLPLASPLVLAAVPLLLERMLATGYPAWWTSSYHYDAFIVMILVLAAVDGAARVERRIQATWPGWRIPAPRIPVAGARLRTPRLPVALAWAAAVCAVAVAVLPWSPLGQLLHPKFYTVNPRISAAEAAVAKVPDGALTEAADYIGPRLSGRTRVLLLDGTPRWAPWVVADTRGLDFPFCSPADQAHLVTYLKANGYTQVFARDGYVVLHRPADGRTRAALSHPAASARPRGNACPRYRQ